MRAGEIQTAEQSAGHTPPKVAVINRYELAFPACRLMGRNGRSSKEMRPAERTRGSAPLVLLGAESPGPHGMPSRRKPLPRSHGSAGQLDRERRPLNRAEEELPAANAARG